MRASAIRLSQTIHSLMHTTPRSITRPRQHRCFSVIERCARATTFDGISALQTRANNMTGPSFLGTKLLHWIVLMRRKTNKKLSAAQRGYKDLHDRGIHAIASARRGRGIYVDGSLLSVTVPNRNMYDSYSILQQQKLGSYGILPFTKKFVTNDEWGKPNLLSPERAWLTLLLEVNAFATRASASHQSGYTEARPGEYSATELGKGTSVAQQQTPKGTTRTTSKVDHNAICDNAKWAERNREDNCEIRIDYIIRRVSKAQICDMSHNGGALLQWMTP